MPDRQEGPHQCWGARWACAVSAVGAPQRASKRLGWLQVTASMAAASVGLYSRIVHPRQPPPAPPLPQEVVKLVRRDLQRGSTPQVRLEVECQHAEVECHACRAVEWRAWRGPA